MKRFKKIILLCFTSLFTFTACDQDILDTTATDQLDSNQVVASISNARGLLFGAYSRLRDNNLYHGDLAALGDILTGNISITTINNGRFAFMYRYDYNPTTNEVENIWREFYALIGNVNPIIARLPEITAEDEDPDFAERDQILAEALSLRALAYFELIRLYSDRYDPGTALNTPGVPIIEASISPSLDPQPRSSLQAVVDVIIEDLNRALSLFDEGSITGNEALTRFTSNSVNALLSRIYLYSEQFNLAIDAADNVSNTLITTEAAYNDMFLNSTGSEVIFKSPIVNTDNPTATFGFVYFFPVGSRQDYIPTNELLGLYEPGDFRRNTSVRLDTGRQTVNKFPDNPNAGNPGFVEFMLIRYAEVVLNRAESYFRSGNSGMALSDLNALRNARNLPDINVSGDALRDAIRLERRLELAFEGHYWHDLKREFLPMFREQVEGCEGAGCLLTIDPNERFWLWPIPNTEIQFNPMINDQNPGY